MADGGFGVTFSIGDGALSTTPTYTAIASVKTFNGDEIASVMSETTAHDSAAGYREFVPSGLFEVSDIELGLAFDISEGTHANSSGGVTHALLNKTLLAYKIELPDSGGTNWVFDAYINKIKWDSPKEEHIMANVTLKVTGQPTLS